MTAAHHIDSVSWTDEDEHALLRRQRWNERAVNLSALLAATAVALVALLSAHRAFGASPVEGAPLGPVDPLALNIPDDDLVGFESSRIEATAGEALERIRYPWRSELPGWTIRFLDPRDQASGYTWTANKRIEVFVAGDDDTDRVARVLAHELGHAVDVTLTDADQRRAWLTERGAPSETAWWPGSGRPDFETGAGDFAEVFAAWQVGADDFKSQVNPEVDAGDYALLEQLAFPGD